MKKRIAILTLIFTIGFSNQIYANPTAGVTKHLADILTTEVQKNITIEPVLVYIPRIVTMYTTTRVNVRKQADINSKVVKVLEKNNKVKVLYTENGWSKVKQGWIKSDYLSERKTDEQ